MRRRWLRSWWFLSGLFLLLVTALILVVAFEPTYVVRGFLRREAFFRGRPTSYWREQMRGDGLRVQMLTVFTDRPDAVPVLLACLEDPEVKVRWTAANLIGRCGAPEQALPALRKALHDTSPKVRLNAVMAFGELGPAALPAVGDLLSLLEDAGREDADDTLRYCTDRSLWRIDVATASRAGGWRSFPSDKYHFLATFPTNPEENEREVETPMGPLVVHSFLARHRVMQCVVAVADHPLDLIEAPTDEERLNMARDCIEAMTGGKRIKDEPIFLDGLRGRELVVSVEEQWKVRSRLFYAGRRLYHVSVTYQERYLNQAAVDYFLNSFRILGPVEERKD
jgi:hypothetical protein